LTANIQSRWENETSHALLYCILAGSNFQFPETGIAWDAWLTATLQLLWGEHGGAIQHREGWSAYNYQTMDAEQIIAEIESLERMFALRDGRPLQASDVSAANRRHDEMLARSPWFRLWQSYGICCRTSPQAPE
jgi:hypothetical protein